MAIRCRVVGTNLPHHLHTQVGGDEKTLLEIKALCIDETPRLVEKMALAFRDGEME